MKNGKMQEKSNNDNKHLYFFLSKNQYFSKIQFRSIQFTPLNCTFFFFCVQGYFNNSDETATCIQICIDLIDAILGKEILWNLSKDFNSDRIIFLKCTPELSELFSEQFITQRYVQDFESGIGKIRFKKVDNFVK